MFKQTNKSLFLPWQEKLLEECKAIRGKLKNLKKMYQPKAARWKPIDTFDKEDGERVDLWIRIYASPRSMGLSDSFRLINAYRKNGKWFDDGGELFTRYITYWMPIP